MVQKKFLVSLPVFHDDLTGLLYYDALVIPLWHPNMLGETWEKLADAKLISNISSIHPFSEKELQSFYNAMFKWRHTKEGTIRYSEGHTNDWLRVHAAFLSNKGVMAIPQYGSTLFNETYKTGTTEVFGVVYSELPYIGLSQIDNVDDFIDFLKDDETQIKRRRLFSWQNDIETKIERGDIKIKHLPDLMATNLDDYTGWITKNIRKTKKVKREFVFCASLSLFGGLTIPFALRKYFELRERKLDLLDDEKAPGRELAYIVHALKRFSN